MGPSLSHNLNNQVKTEHWNVRTRCALIQAGSWILGGVLLAAGVALSGNDMAWLAALVGQAGSPNPRLLEKLRLVPMLTVATGAEFLLLAVSLWFFRQRISASWVDRVPRLGSGQFGVWLLLCAWTAIAVLSLNFGVITLVNRLKQNWGRSSVELIAADFGDDYRVVRSVRETTPETAALLIKTQRPLQFLLNYELYPRKFYFYPERDTSVSSIPQAWLDQRRIGWILEISDTEPLQFKLAPRKVSF
jgi:hypothetical protein